MPEFPQPPDFQSLETIVLASPEGFVLRPARRQDRHQITKLTRKLHRTAIPQPSWHYWLGGGIVGILLAIGWRYPSETMAVIVSSMPLWVSILLVIVIADYEQQRNWDQYWVVEYESNLIGCGRLDLHNDHSEIYDLFVLPEWRCHGVGCAIMQQLIKRATLPIYLASLPNATQFYQRLGFKPIAAQALPIFLAGRLSLTSPRYQRVGLQAMALYHQDQSAK